MQKDVLKDKSYAFAIRIVRLSQYLQNEHKEFVLSRQILKSGTSIGALVREAKYAQSTLDFIHKLSIALKEANETYYWLSLMYDTNYIEVKLFNSLLKDCDE
jgi:four helix bundle protein